MVKVLAIQMKFRSLLQRGERGFSLLEILLVLLVAAIIALLGVGRYQQLQQEKDLLLVQKNAQYLLSALDTYYHLHVVRGDFDNRFDTNKVNRAAVVEGDLWPTLLDNNLVTLSGTNPEVGAENITPPKVTPRVYRLWAQMLINYFPTSVSDPNIAWYKNSLHAAAATVDGSTGKLLLIWYAAVGVADEGRDNSLWVSAGSAKSFKKYAPNPQF